LVDTKILELSGTEGDKGLIAEAAAAIRMGMLVVFPTETVYGLGCCASRPDSVKRIYDLKGRSSAKPLAFYVLDPREISRYCVLVSEAAKLLMDRFWPGPLTVILPRGDGGRIGFRCPGDKIALSLLAEAGIPVVGTSANRSGAKAPRSGSEAVAAMAGLADLVLKGGATRFGKESTIVDVTGPEPFLVREGVIGREEIETVLGRACASMGSEEGAR